MHAVSSNAFKGRTNLIVVRDILLLPFVIELRRLKPQHTISPELRSTFENVQGSDGKVKVDIRLEHASEVPKLLSWLQERHIELCGHSENGRIIRISVSTTQQEVTTYELACRQEIDSVELYVPPTTYNDAVRTALQQLRVENTGISHPVRLVGTRLLQMLTPASTHLIPTLQTESKSVFRDGGLVIALT